MRRLFEDLVVSSPAPPLSRRAVLMPLSIAVHAFVLAMALLVPVLRPSELPAPAILDVLRLPPAPAAVVPPLPPRVGVGPRPARPVREVPARMPALPAVEPPAPGPLPSLSELPADLTGEAPSPCLKDCDMATGPHGSGDGRYGIGGTDDGSGPAGGVKPVRPGGEIDFPVRVTYVAPVYPDLARMAGVTAVVVLECTIDPRGHVADVRVVAGHPLLNDAAVAAVRQWRYTPTRLNGVPVPVLMTVTVRFLQHR